MSSFLAYVADVSARSDSKAALTLTKLQGRQLQSPWCQYHAPS